MASPKKKSFTGISSKNKKEVLSKKLPKISADSQEFPIDLAKDNSVKVQPALPEPTPATEKIRKTVVEEDYKDVDHDLRRENRGQPKGDPDLLPDVEIPVDSDAVKKALVGLLNLFDTHYFMITKGQQVCSLDKFSRDCLAKCQHFTVCRLRLEVKNSIKNI
jgi:hypothetical protein